jgi:lipid-A-disaccharide synthase
VTIDAPSFCAGVWRRLGTTEAKLIHYVAPSVWAWRPGRAAKLARRIDHLMTLLPFEPPYFERVGLPATFVGHPVVESGAVEGNGPAFRQRHGIAPEAPLVCVLPGSRLGEVRRLLRPFGEAVARLAERRRGLAVAVPTVATVAASIVDEVSAWPIRTVLVRDERDKFDAMAASEVALAASGTVTLELALAGTPMVVAYRMNPITHRLVRAMVRIEHAALVNILAGREAVPELIQGEATPARLAAALERLIADPAARAAQRETFERIAVLLQADETPSLRAARVVLETIGQGAMMAKATNGQGDR